MCGIAGVRRMDDDSAPISIWRIEQLLIDAQNRGVDATGVALQYEDGAIHICKAAEIAWRFVQSRLWKDFVDRHSDDGVVFKQGVRTALGHARASSVGGAYKNENNHPVFNGHTAVTHNGTVRNHEFIFKDLKLERKAEVDTDTIRAIFDRWGFGEEAVSKLNRLSGPIAMACVSQDLPDKFILARSGSPLVLAAWKDDGQLVWSSRKEGIHRASRGYEQRWGIPFQANKAELVFNPMPLETLWVFEGGKMVRSYRFTSNNGQLHELTYKCHDTAPARKKEQREKAAEVTVKEIKAAEKLVPGTAILKAPARKPDILECPSRCGVFLEFDESDANVPLEFFTCPECGTQLGGGAA